MATKKETAIVETEWSEPDTVVESEWVEPVKEVALGPQPTITSSPAIATGQTQLQGYIEAIQAQQFPSGSGPIGSNPVSGDVPASSSVKPISTVGVTPVPLTKKEQVQINAAEGFLNSIKRGANQAEIANMMAVGQTPSKDDLRKISEINKQNLGIKPSQAYEDFNRETTLSGSVSKFIKDPFEITSQLVGESLSAMIRHGYSRAAVGAAGGAVAGSVMPGVGTLAGAGLGYIAGMGVAGYNLEIAGSIMDSLKDAGVDVTDEKSLVDAFSNEETISKAREYANKRAVPIALFDMFSAGIAGKLLGKSAKTVLGKVAKAAGEVGVQSTLAGTGEATAQMVSEGKIKPNEIFAEMIGEVGGGAPDIIVGTSIEKAKNGESAKRDLVGLNIPKENFEDMIEVSESLNEITPEQSDKLKKDFNLVQQAKESAPPEFKGNVDVIEILSEKKNLQNTLLDLDAEAKSVDESFGPLYDEKKKIIQDNISDLDKRIAEKIAPNKDYYTTEDNAGNILYHEKDLNTGKEIIITKDEYDRNKLIQKQNENKIQSEGEGEGKKPEAKSEVIQKDVLTESETLATPVAEVPLIEEVKVEPLKTETDAIKTGEEQKSDQLQREGVDTQREAATPIDSDSSVGSGEVKSEKEKITEIVNSFSEDVVNPEQKIAILDQAYKMENPIIVFKGVDGKKTPEGNPVNVHPDVNGIFGSQDILTAEDYGKTNGVDFLLVDGVSENVSVPGDTPISKIREVETELINNSKADVVYLQTIDAKGGRHTQVIIKNPESAINLGNKKPGKSFDSNQVNIPKESTELLEREKVKSSLKEKYSDLFKRVKEDVATKIDKAADTFVKVFPITDIFKSISKAQEPLRALKDKTENAISISIKEGLRSQNKAINAVANTLNNIYGGLSRTRGDVQQKLRFTGTARDFSVDEATTLSKELYEIVQADPKALINVHKVLDPELYEAKDQIKYEDLNDAEKALYDKLREINNFTHDLNFSNGFLGLETYNKFKDKYIGRAYEEFVAPEIDSHLNDKNNAFNGTGNINTKIFEARNDVDKWIKDNKVSDPVFLTSYRFMQSVRNDAVKSYIDYINGQRDLVWEPTPGKETPPKGFTKLSDSPAWGDVKGKYMANHVLEDFKGFFFATQMTDTFYKALKLYDKTKLRQFLKKYNTVYSPSVQLGNMSSNYVFAFLSGISPVELSANIPKAFSEIKNRGDVYKLMLKNGLISSTSDVADLKPQVYNNAKFSNTQKASGVLAGLSKLDEVATKAYQGSDNVAKISAFISLREQGFSDRKAMDMVYDGFQNYATVGKLWDVASKTPVIGNPYIKFQADLQRIIKNSATSRPLNTAAFLSILGLTAKYLSESSGESEEERKIREGRKGIPKLSFLPGQTPIPLVWKVGKSEVNAARYLSPLYIYDTGYGDADLQEYSKFLPYQAIKVGEENVGEDRIVPAFSDPFLGTIAQVVFDTDYRGKSISNPEATRFKNPNPTSEEKILNSLNYMARSIVPFYKNAADFTSAMNGDLDYYGRQRDWKQAILNNFIKVQEFDSPQVRKAAEGQIDFLTSKFATLSQRAADANKISMDKIQKDRDRGVDPKKLAEKINAETLNRNKRISATMGEQKKIQEDLEKLLKVYTTIYKDADTEEVMYKIEQASEKIQSLKDYNLSEVEDE